jgi:hypothetical protein
MATGMGALAAAGTGTLWRRTSLARAVPSAPHEGQLTGAGMRPWTGSTSNLYFVPQGHWILISIALRWLAREIEAEN